MKSGLMKWMACLAAGSMMLTGGAGTAFAAGAGTAEAGKLATPVSGVSLLLPQIAAGLDGDSAGAASGGQTAEPAAAAGTSSAAQEAVVSADQGTDPADGSRTVSGAQEAGASADAAASGQKKAEKEEDYSDIGVAKVEDYVNIRSKPSTDSKVVGKLSKNAVATVLKKENGWCKIKSGSIEGYIKAEYLSVGDTELVESVKYRAAKVQTETLRVRVEPSEDAGVLSLVDADDVLKVVDENDEGWVKVKTADGKGYVSSDYVKAYDTFNYAQSIQSDGSSSGSGGGGVASYALQFVGNPYVWGGTSLTNGADCSGFVMSVFAHYGISLPHSSGAMRGVGRGVSYSEAQPGDIICYSGHVGIYIGGGQIVHASNHRDGIKVSDATYRSIAAVRRVL